MREFLSYSEHQHAAKPATHQRYLTSSNALLRAFGKCRLDTITPEEVERYKVRRTNQVSERLSENRFRAFG